MREALTSGFLEKARIPDFCVEAALAGGAAGGSFLAFFPPNHECTRVLTARSVRGVCGVITGVNLTES